MSGVTAGYVVQTSQGSWQVAGSRVSLDSVVYAYWEGLSPEAIVAAFPSLCAEQVYGAIAFYLHNRHEIDQYIGQQKSRWEELKERSETENGPLLERLRAARAARESTG
jgi:uncharacterized protein (DUF433 family)